MSTWTQVCISIPTAKGIGEGIDHLHRIIQIYPGPIAAILLIWSYFPEFPFNVVYVLLYAVPRGVCIGILNLLGCRRVVVVRDTLPSNYQSPHYVGQVLSDSPPTYYQSYGATDLDPSYSVSDGEWETSRGLFMTALSYALFVAAGVVLWIGFKARL